jgi:hypothetical protein
MRTYAEFVDWFWVRGPGSLAPLPPETRFRQFKAAYKHWLDEPDALRPRADELPHSVAGLVDWFVDRYGPQPPRREPALRERYWRLWDRTIRVHMLRRKNQARAGARILRRLGFALPPGFRSRLPGRG